MKNILAKRQEEIDKQYAEAEEAKHRQVRCDSSMKPA